MEKNHVLRPYFAHAVNSYDTPLERALVTLIAAYFQIPAENVENPNQPRHQEGYTNYAKRANQASTNHKGMSYFYDEVLPGCDSCVAMPFLDGRMGLGVAGEVKWFINKDRPSFIIASTADVTPEALRGFEQHPRDRVLFLVRPLNADEKNFVLADDKRLVVPHEETRLRTFVVYGKEKRPFETAHLVTMPVPAGFYPDKK